MISKSLTRITAEKLLALTFFLLVGGFLSSAQAADKYTSSGGDWNSLTWMESGTATTTPTSADFANIGDGFAVELAGAGGAGQVRVGSTVGGMTASGTLTHTSGTMTVNGSGSSALRIGYSSNSDGVFYVNGGLVQTTGAGWLNVGAGLGSSGVVYLNSGTIAVDAYVALGGINSAGNSASGAMYVSGGLITTGTDFSLGRNASGTNTGIYEQTAGINRISRNLRIGSGTIAGQATIGTFLITGGELSVGGDVQVGYTGAVLGSGEMTIGSNVDFVSGSDTMFDVGGNGEIIFKLGADDTFASIDLTPSSATNVLDLDSGSKITIDGSDLVFSSGYDPIDLFTFGSGQGPTALSQSNVTFAFTGFDSGFATPSLVWTDTSLQLTVVPEPSVVGLIALASVLGLARRRRTA